MILFFTVQYKMEWEIFLLIINWKYNKKSLTEIKQFSCFGK